MTSMLVDWKKINLKSKTQKNLPEPGTECLLVWTAESVHCATMQYNQSGHFVCGNEVLKPKTGMRWCRTEDIISGTHW